MHDTDYCCARATDIVTLYRIQADAYRQLVQLVREDDYQRAVQLVAWIDSFCLDGGKRDAR